MTAGAAPLCLSVCSAAARETSVTFGLLFFCVMCVCKRRAKQAMATGKMARVNVGIQCCW